MDGNMMHLENGVTAGPVAPGLNAANEGCMALTRGNWSVVASAVRGTSHDAQAIPCQDAFHMQITDDGLVAVLCDGAGSAPKADLGAATVSAEVCQFLATEDHRDLDRAAILGSARGAIEQLVGRFGGKPEHYACTLLAIKLVGERVATYHLGDGLVVVGRAGRPEAVSLPGRGEYANSTVFVTSPGAEENLKIRFTELDPEVRSLVLMTDGLQNQMFDPRSRKVSQSVEQVASWLDDAGPETVAGSLHGLLENRLRHRTHDDCSMVVVRRAKAKGEVFPPACPDCGSWLLVQRRVGRRTLSDCPNCRGLVELPGARAAANPVVVKRPETGTLPASDWGLVMAAGKEGMPEEGVPAIRWQGYARPSNELTRIPTLKDLKSHVRGAVSAWQERPLDHVMFVMLGEIRLPAGKSRRRVRVAVGITESGHREILAHHPVDRTSSWKSFLQGIRGRGLVQPRLVVHGLSREAMVAANQVWPQAPRQVCVVEFRDALAEVATEGGLSLNRVEVGTNVGSAVKALRESLGHPDMSRRAPRWLEAEAANLDTAMRMYPRGARRLATLGALHGLQGRLARAGAVVGETDAQPGLSLAMAEVSDEWKRGRAYLGGLVQ